MTEDEAQAWLKYRRIKHPFKPSEYADEPGWRCRLMRPTKAGLSLLVVVPKATGASLLRLIAIEAWEKYPNRKNGDLANQIWQFFTHEELRELAQGDWSE
jgi:hypothetical protein